jgi:flagellar basal body rod protein FlgC
MIQGLSISSSGLAHNEKRLNASVHNTANLNTEYAARAHVRAEEIPAAGVQTHHFASDRDITAFEESVEQILAGHHFTANVRAAQTQDEMLGVLLDVRG